VTESIREPDARTLAAFLSGECTTSESADVLRWARSSPEADERLRVLRAAWEAALEPRTGSVGTWSAERVWSGIAAQLDAEQQEPLRLVSPTHGHRVAAQLKPREHGVSRWTIAAACVLLGIGIWADQHFAHDRARAAVRVQVSMREYRTDRGQRASVTLPDGSAARLGPLSVLRVPSSYGVDTRTVELEGDGYFNVTHDARKPFAVRTSRSTIRDVGTRFIVRARPTESRIEVAVADGEVAIESVADAGASADGARAAQDASPLHVTAGRVAMIDERGVASLLANVSAQPRFAWTRGELTFDHVPVPAVLAELGRWYGETFVLADASLQHVRLTTTIRGETLLEALVVLETALDVDARVTGDTVTLAPHRGGHR
jgi:ferric-dicitrate binding protein FerR (iron transport regulator)